MSLPLQGSLELEEGLIESVMQRFEGFGCRVGVPLESN